ncbi:MAG: hypothetical protein JXA95_06445 [Spirochaetales bacterium]|nr:hypothetical protein [Spirochaetales bacterium]
MKDFLAITDFSSEMIYDIFDRADSLHKHWHDNTMPRSLRNRKIALWSWGKGFRNPVAFEIGAKALGAEISHIPGDLGIHEPLEDIAFYLNNWFDMAVIRCQNHNDLTAFSKDFKGPVINARTNINHPCEIMGDLQFIRRERGSIEDLNILFVGEVTNLCMSWFEAAVRLPIKVTQIAPEQYLYPEDQMIALNKDAVGEISATTEWENSITGNTDVIYTDCWPGDQDMSVIEELFLPYQVRGSHLTRMNQKGFFLPCPPVTRNQEVSSEALKMELYRDYEAKEFLLHTQNAIMEYLAQES